MNLLVLLFTTGTDFSGLAMAPDETEGPVNTITRIAMAKEYDK